MSDKTLKWVGRVTTLGSVVFHVGVLGYCASIDAAPVAITFVSAMLVFTAGNAAITWRQTREW